MIIEIAYRIVTAITIIYGILYHNFRACFKKIAKKMIANGKDMYRIVKLILQSTEGKM